jgi:adenosylhomocysteine nucleosidase
MGNKALYVRRKDDGSRAGCDPLAGPGIGEIMGGRQCEAWLESVDSSKGIAASTGSTTPVTGSAPLPAKDALDNRTPVLVLTPLAEEWSILVKAYAERNRTETLPDLRVPCQYVAAWRMVLAQGGHGKTQCAVQAQYLISRFPSAALVVCVGAAGSLDPNLSVGDVVVGTETVEHDYRLLFATRPLPRFRGDTASVMRLREAAAGLSGFRIAFDVIASGDEDVVSSSRAAELRTQTGAVCVAWEGSGAARAAAFNDIGSLEIRGVTDAADKEAPQDFHNNLPIAMGNLFRLLAVLPSMES